MNKIIIEKMENCPLVKEGSEPNGHDCWGKYEYSSYSYVFFNDKIEKLSKGMYIVHDGKKILGTGFIEHLDDSLRKHLDENLDKKLKDTRRKRYIELKKEFEKEEKK